LWNAQWGGSKVVRYNKNGDVDFELPLPVSQPSCLAFGGPNLSWLIVTSAKQGLTPDKLTQEKHAGDVFIYQLDHVTGIKESLIKRS
jgi:sugar lactone lactonase YvrE